jgi:predicted nucleotide-binding protein
MPRINTYKPRIFLSCINDVKTSQQKTIKKEIIRKVEAAGFRIQSFREKGKIKNTVWSPVKAFDMMRRCDGALIIGLSRFKHVAEDKEIGIPTEYNHYEGAVAALLNLPLLIISEHDLEQRGIFAADEAFKAHLAEQVNAEWFNKDAKFKTALKSWAVSVRKREQIFLGYCGKSVKTAKALKGLLQKKYGLGVKEYQSGFTAGKTIMKEIEEASNNCQCGIFLFTEDELIGDHSLPRDNVVFEAGYFKHAKDDRVLIIKESGVKLLDDLGGIIYLPLQKGKDISAIEKGLKKFLNEHLLNDK